MGEGNEAQPGHPSRSPLWDAHGLVVSPVGSRMGLGAWHAISCGVGVAMKSRTRFQNGVPVPTCGVRRVVKGRLERRRSTDNVTGGLGWDEGGGDGAHTTYQGPPG